MKILKTILHVYLGILIISVFGIFLLFPIFLVNYFNNENYFFIFLVNLPIIFGFIFHYIEPIGETNIRPKR